MLGLSTEGHPLSGGFLYQLYVIFHSSGGVIFLPTTPTRTVQYIYQLIANISTTCLPCHLTDSQISLQADWLWLCSLQASVHIYTVTYRVTYRRVCTYYIVGHNRHTTWMHACLYIINFHINL